MRLVPSEIRPLPGKEPLYFYRKNVQVPEDFEAAAADAVSFFANHLRVSAPEITWIELVDYQTAINQWPAAHRVLKPSPHKRDFVVDPGPNHRGLTPFDFRHEIFVNGRLDNVPNVNRTIAHEMRHVWQEKRYGRAWRKRYSGETDLAEQDACKFEAKAFKIYPPLKQWMDEDKELRDAIEDALRS